MLCHFTWNLEREEQDSENEFVNIFKKMIKNRWKKKQGEKRKQ